MEILIEKKKKEIIEYVSNSENEAILDELLSIVHEPEAGYNSFDFEKEWAKGLTIEQAKEESKNRIKEWWGK